jgi:hypothetical protein
MNRFILKDNLIWEEREIQLLTTKQSLKKNITRKAALLLKALVEGELDLKVRN